MLRILTLLPLVLFNLTLTSSKLYSAPEEEKLYKRIDELIATGRNLSALRLVNDQIEKQPQSEFAWHAKGGIFHDLGNNYKAIASFEKAIEINPAHIESYTSLSMIWQYGEMNSQKASEVANLAVINNPDSAEAFVCRGIMHNSFKKDPERALKDFEKAVNLEPTKPSHQIHIINWFRSNRPPAELLTRSKRAFELFPDDAQICVSYAIALQSAGQADKALRELQSLLTRDSTSPSAYLGLARFHRNNNDSHAELETLDLLASTFKDHASYQLMPIQHLLRQEQDVIARQRFEKWVKSVSPPERGVGYMKIADHYFQKKDYQTAADYFSSALASNEELRHAYTLRSICLRNLGKIAQCLEDIQTLRNMYPDDAFSLYLEIEHHRNFGTPAELFAALQEIPLTPPCSRLNKSWMSVEISNLIKIYKTKGEPQKALAAANYAIEHLVPSARSYTTRAELYEDSNQVDSALADYNAAIQLDPKSAFMYIQLADFYRNLSRTEDALKAYNRAIELDPAYAYAYTSRATFHESLKDYSSSRADFEKAIELDPSDAYAQNSLGRLLFKLGEMEKAIEHYTLAIQNDPKYHYAYSARGKALQSQGKHSEAINDFNKAITLKPNNDLLLLWRAESLMEQGKHNAAFNDILNALTISKLVPKPTLARNVLCAMTPQELALAVDRITAISEKMPKNPGLFYMRAIAHELDGQPIKSKDDFNRVRSLIEADKNL